MPGSAHEVWYQYATGRDAALRMFPDDIDKNVADLLGLVIIDGEFRGGAATVRRS